MERGKLTVRETLVVTAVQATGMVVEWDGGRLPRPVGYVVLAETPRGSMTLEFGDPTNTFQAGDVIELELRREADESS